MAVCEMRGKAASMVVMWPVGARPAEFGVMRRVAAELGVDPAKAAARVSDDDRSVAADLWSMKSDNGSTLDDEQRYALCVGLRLCGRALRVGLRQPLVRLQDDDALESKQERRFELVMDEGTLDAIRLHPDGPVKRQIMIYWQSVAGLVSPGGILVITSCSRTKDELV